MKTRILLAALMIIIPLSFASQAQAVTLTLFDGTNTLSIADNSALDLNPAAGQITAINGSVGTFTFSNFSATFSTAGGNLDMNWSGTAIHAAGAGTLTVTLSDNLGGWDLTSGTFASSGNQGVAGLTLGTSTAYNGGAAFLGPLNYDTSPAGLSWSNSQFLGAAVGPINAISIGTTITFNGAGNVNPSGSLTGSIPEPSILLLLGLGLGGIGLVRICRKK